MIVAFSDLVSRTDAIHASLLVAGAIGASGVPVTRILVSSDAEDEMIPSIDGARTCGLADAHRLVRDARRDDLDVVLLLPRAAWRDLGLRRLVDVPLVVVGPYAEDERAAAAEFFAAGEMDGAASAWYIGCRRSGGAAAASSFLAGMSDLGPVGRLIPVTLPALSRSEAESLSRGVVDPRVLSSAGLIVSVLRRIAADPCVDRFDVPSAANADARSFVERLRELADYLECLDRSRGPAANALAGAPVLQGWAFGIAPVPVLSGVVGGHPGVPDGRPVVTTQVMATDNATWARTLSRFYVLAAPAGTARSAHLQ